MKYILSLNLLFLGFSAQALESRISDLIVQKMGWGVSLAHLLGQASKIDVVEDLPVRSEDISEVTGLLDEEPQVKVEIYTNAWYSRNQVGRFSCQVMADGSVENKRLRTLVTTDPSGARDKDLRKGSSYMIESLIATNTHLMMKLWQPWNARQPAAMIVVCEGLTLNDSINSLSQALGSGFQILP
jgi:hypothetical protein